MAGEAESRRFKVVYSCGVCGRGFSVICCFCAARETYEIESGGLKGGQKFVFMF